MNDFYVFAFLSCRLSTSNLHSAQSVTKSFPLTHNHNSITSHTHSSSGHLREAEELLEKSLEIQKNFSGENSPEAAVSMNNLGVLCTHLGKCLCIGYRVEK